MVAGGWRIEHVWRMLGRRSEDYISIGSLLVRNVSYLCLQCSEYIAVHCSAVNYSAVQYSAVWCSADNVSASRKGTRCSLTDVCQYKAVAQCSVVQCSEVQHIKPNSGRLKIFQYYLQPRGILPNSRFSKVKPLINKNLEWLYSLGVVWLVVCLFLRLDQGCQNQQEILQGLANNQTKTRTVLVDSRHQTVYHRQQTIDSRQQKVDSRQQTVEMASRLKFYQNGNDTKAEMSPKRKCHPK